VNNQNDDLEDQLKRAADAVDAYLARPPALSVRQPWADLIMGGWKPVENRTWTTDYRGPVIIHAGKTWDTPPPDVAFDLSALGITSKKSPRGYLGVVDLVSVHPASACMSDSVCGGWGQPGDDMFHWVVTAPRRFPEPITGSGHLSLYRWDIPVAVYDELQKVMTTSGRQTDKTTH
jgi:hypothetical protein